MSDERPMPTIVYIEVNVSAVIQEPDGSVFGQNMVDATLGFAWRTEQPKAGTSDAAVNTALSKAISPVLAVIQTALTFQGWIATGEVADPMATHATDTGLSSRSTPVRVILQMPDESQAIHD